MSNPSNKKSDIPYFPIEPLSRDDLPKDKQHQQEVPVDPKEEVKNDELYNGPNHEDKPEESHDIDRKDHEACL